MFYVLKHPSTDRVVYTDRYSDASPMVADGWWLICTSPMRPDSLRPLADQPQHPTQDRADG